MFKLLNKKGFTLVELMIVVVVLGILVGIAVPIYSASRDNAEKRTCYANMRMIISACTQYFVEHNTYDGLVPTSLSLNLSTDTVPNYLIDKFDSSGIPKCPKGGVYIIECDAGLNDTKITISCTSNGDGFDGHGNYHS